MNKDDFFKGIYDDFFGIGKIEKENEKLRNDIKNLKGIDIEEAEANIPSIELSQENRESQAVTTIDKDKFMEDIFKKIDELYIEEDSKNTLKKIVEYIRKSHWQEHPQAWTGSACARVLPHISGQSRPGRFPLWRTGPP